MFAKIINNVVIDYPYNPQDDYPLTSFPVGESYPDFNCYWVESTVPNNPNLALYDAAETTPVLNNGRWEQAWTFVEKPQLLPLPKWDDFNLAFLTLPSLLQAEIIANQNHPSIVGKKDLAYSMINQHGVATFAMIFPLFCQFGDVQPETRIEWVELAESFNMPDDFVSIIRG